MTKGRVQLYLTAKKNPGKKRRFLQPREKKKRGQGLTIEKFINQKISKREGRV